MKKIFFAGLFIILVALPGFAQTSGVDAAGAEEVITFKFAPGKDGFYAAYGKNYEKLASLYEYVDRHKELIKSGRISIQVFGYCTSMPGREANLRMAAIRSRRVKSELIYNKGLREGNFITKNYAKTYNGQKDIVVVKLQVTAETEKPAIPDLPPPAAVQPQEQPLPQPEYIPEPVPEPEPWRQPVSEPQPEPAPFVPEPEESFPYRFALRTNLLYDAALLPSAGVEWRISPAVGLKVDGSYSYWGDEHGKVQKIWLVNPEARLYLGDMKRFYVGASANFAKYNVNEYLIGGLLSDDAGYQGRLWNAGLTTGYQLPLSRNFSLDFNLGLGYTNLEYDSFTIREETRIYKEKDKSKNFWGPSQAGISLIWTIK